MIDKKHLRSMMHSPVRNYAIPGLTSWLIGNPSPTGTLRFFECSRDHVEPITPHSHRFDFQCWVLAGTVKNRVWRYSGSNGDIYGKSRLVYAGDCGKYTQERAGDDRFVFSDTVYETGEWYSMTADMIHSIYFSNGAQVLFFEGPTISDVSVILEPVVDGETIPTFEVKPWMFQRDPTLPSTPCGRTAT
jgi:hypothetical protein